MSREPISDPWAWCPGKAPWFRLIEDRVGSWRPDGLLDDLGPVQRSLLSAARAEAPWLYDPAAAALLAPRGGEAWVRDVQLIALLASRDDSLAPCRLNLPAAAALYLGASATSVGPGTISLGDLAGLWADPRPGAIGSLDLCARSVVAEGEDLWRTPEEVGDARSSSLLDLLAQFRASLDRMPGCRSWLEPVFRVVVPTKSEDVTQSSSRSYEYFPGVVFADWQSGLEAAVEVVVHETAHHYFNLHTFGGHLVPPADPTLAWSPIVGKRRPLVRVLLAYHAIAYMSCFYRDWLDLVCADSTNAVAALETLALQAAAYEEAIDAVRDHLTPRGLRLTDATAAVAARGLRPR